MAEVESDNFIKIPFAPQNLDRFVVRTSILKSLKENLNKFNGRLLDVGCGKMPYRDYILRNSSLKEYVGLDIDSAKNYDKTIRPDYTWDGKEMPFPDYDFDSVFATEVLEHCPEPEVFLKEVYRVLKPGGAFFFTVPFLWNLHEVPHDEYRYTPFSLQRHLQNCGFASIEIKAMGGWHASMAQMLGLWVRRAPLPSISRRLLSLLLKPVISFLLRKDGKYKWEFKEGVMITGLTGIAIK